jgi:hypothetical protein
MSTCFICLNSCAKRVCPRCQCYAHPTCWGQYLQSTTSAETLITETNVSTIQPLYATCPQCKQNIPGIKPLTRKDTQIARYYAFKTQVIFFAKALDEWEISPNIVGPEFTKLFKEHRGLVLDEKELCLDFHYLLLELYEMGWKEANIHHHSFFGTQLFDWDLSPP